MLHKRKIVAAFLQHALGGCDAREGCDKSARAATFLLAHVWRILLTDPAQPRSIPISALLLGLGGVVPFVGLTILMHLSTQPDLKFFVGRSLISYAAVILSFLGGARWGLALTVQSRKLQALHLTLAIIPPLCAWTLLTARLDTAVASFALLFAAVGLLDVLSFKSLMAPPWYGRLRSILSILVVATLVGAMFTL